MKSFILCPTHSYILCVVCATVSMNSTHDLQSRHHYAHVIGVETETQTALVSASRYTQGYPLLKCLEAAFLGISVLGSVGAAQVRWALARVRVGGGVEPLSSRGQVQSPGSVLFSLPQLGHLRQLHRTLCLDILPDLVQAKPEQWITGWIGLGRHVPQTVKTIPS